MNIFDLSDEISVVIGGTGVLGGAIARGLAAAGSKLAVLGRNEERGAQRVEEIESAGGTSIFVPCDATDSDSLAAAHRTVCDQFGSVSVLVNAAGGNHPSVTLSPDHPFQAITRDDWAASFDLNLVGGALLPCQEFGPAMVTNGRGSIVNIASIASHIPLSNVVAYSAAKAALLSLTQFLAREWAPNGVRVNSITPGFFPGEQNRRLLFEEDGSPTLRASQILGHTPMARFGDPDELIGAAVFLASAKASSFVTGSDLRVDGGFLSTTI
jgi:NAD(P)-dependent dehydrogenase (short-subunit alcohol dehydrogenase family)